MIAMTRRSVCSAMVLVRLANIASESLRATDRFGRFGGEEFVVLLPETDQQHAVEAAERLLSSVRQAKVDIDGEAVAHFTISIGVATLPQQGHDAEELIKSADAALYRAKSYGRDQWQA